MCSPVAMGVATAVQGGLSAISQAQQTKAANRQARRDYEYKLAIRKNRWMRELSIYGTKKVQFEKSIDESNIAAQRAYTQSQINFNNIRSQAMLDHMEDFRSMLKAEGMIEASAAERGIRGSTVNRLIASNVAKLGVANAARTRALTQTLYRVNQSNENVKRQLRSRQNELFGQVAISPVPDIPPPAPVMQNVGAQLFLGLASAGFDAAGSYFDNKAPSITGKTDFIGPYSQEFYAGRASL